MDAGDRRILVRYRYLRRHRGYWDETAPMVGRVAGLTNHLVWRDEPRKDIDIASDDWARRLARTLRRPETEPPRTLDEARRSPFSASGPPVPNQWLEEWRSRPVTFLRPVLQTHQQIIDWVEARINEGVRAQYNLALTLADVAALHEKGNDEMQGALKRLRDAGVRGI